MTHRQPRPHLPSGPYLAALRRPSRQAAVRIAHIAHVVAPAALALLATVAGLASLPAQAAPGAAPQGCIQVDVRNLRPQQGMLMVAAYTEEAEFNQRPTSLLQLRVGTEPATSLMVCGIAGPAVALMLFQDLNGNGQLDRNVFGVPSEPWGASGQTPAFSAPTWASSRVGADGQPVVVQLSM